MSVDLSYQLPLVSYQRLESNFYSAVQQYHESGESDEDEFEVLSAADCITLITEADASTKTFFTNENFLGAAVDELLKARTITMCSCLAHLLRNFMTVKTARSPVCDTAKSIISGHPNCVAAITHGFKLCLDASDRSLQPNFSSAEFFALGECLRWLASALCCVTTEPNDNLNTVRKKFVNQETISIMLQLLVAVKNGIDWPVSTKNTQKKSSENDDDQEKREPTNSTSTSSASSSTAPHYVIRISPDALRWFICTFCNLSRDPTRTEQDCARLLYLDAANRNLFLPTMCYIAEHYPRHSPESIQWILVLVANATQHVSIYTGVNSLSFGDPITMAFCCPQFLKTLTPIVSQIKTDEAFYWLLKVLQRLDGVSNRISVADFIRADSKFVEQYIRCFNEFKDSHYTRAFIPQLPSRLSIASFQKDNFETYNILA